MFLFFFFFLDTDIRVTPFCKKKYDSWDFKHFKTISTMLKTLFCQWFNNFWVNPILTEETLPFLNLIFNFLKLKNRVNSFWSKRKRKRSYMNLTPCEETRFVMVTWPYNIFLINICHNNKDLNRQRIIMEKKKRRNEMAKMQMTRENHSPDISINL